MRVPAVDIVVPDSAKFAIVEELSRLLDEGRFSQGRNIQEFEDAFAAYVGAKHAIAMNSGTSALECILAGLIAEGQTVLVPANTNFAVYVAVVRAGGVVRFIDVDPQTLSPSSAVVRLALTGPKPAALVMVHMGGLISPDLSEIAEMCAVDGVALVEDCAHAHGSWQRGSHAGTSGIAGAFSFFSTKVLTTGEGGMVVTDDDHLADEVRLRRNMGKRSTWVSVHERVSANSRMTEIAGLLGRVGIRSLEENVHARRVLASRYVDELAGVVDIIAPWHLYSGYKVVTMLPTWASRAEVRSLLAERDIELPGEIYEVPLHKQPALIQLYDGEVYPGAEESCARQLCLPIYPTLSFDQLSFVSYSLSRILAGAR